MSEGIFAHIPFINKIYLAIQQVNTATLTRRKKLLQQAVAVEYPRKGIYSIRFVTNTETGELDTRVREPMVYVLTVMFLIQLPDLSCGSAKRNYSIRYDG
jgi:uncharacterized membrane protein